MEDMQSRHDGRGIDIDQVGVSGVRYPIIVLDRENGQQHTIAQLSMSVNLPHQFKGTHMSRFIEVLSTHRGEMTMRTLPAILDELKAKLHAESARIEVRFPYFIDRAAPVSRARALMDYECWFVGEMNGITNDFMLGVRVPVTSLCPCSKAISDYGAHNQRGHVTIELRTLPDDNRLPAIVWFEELVDVAERSGSAPVYPLLKRVDERHVTMQAYDNPAFVEDVVRNVAVQLQSDPRVSSFSVHAANEESIHNHTAYARLQWTRPTAVERTSSSAHLSTVVVVS